MGADGSVRVVTLKGGVYAYDRKGQLKWKKQVEVKRDDLRYGDCQPVVRMDGTMYFTISEGRSVIAFDGKGNRVDLLKRREK